MPSGILFDLDGVIYNEDALIPGAAETVSWACSRGIPYLFVTNTTSRNRAALVEKLRRFGIESDASHILTVVSPGWFAEPADLPDELQRGRPNLFRSDGRIEIEKRFDAPGTYAQANKVANNGRLEDLVLQYGTAPPGR